MYSYGTEYNILFPSQDRQDLLLYAPCRIVIYTPVAELFCAQTRAWISRGEVFREPPHQTR